MVSAPGVRVLLRRGAQSEVILVTKYKRRNSRLGSPMFHVEHGPRCILLPAIGKLMCIYAAYKNLAFEVLKQSTQGITVLGVQFRWQVVHQKYAVQMPATLF